MNGHGNEDDGDGDDEDNDDNDDGNDNDYHLDAPHQHTRRRGWDGEELLPVGEKGVAGGGRVACHHPEQNANDSQHSEIHSLQLWKYYCTAWCDLQDYVRTFSKLLKAIEFFPKTLDFGQ